MLTDHREYANWNEYRQRYYRKATQVEARAHYNEPKGVIIVHAMMVERDDAPEPPNKPFQRFCVVHDSWREVARDIMIENEFQEQMR